MNFTNDEGGHDRDGNTDDGQAPCSLEGRNDEKDRDEDRDDGENRMRRKSRLDIGIQGAVD